MNRLLYFAAPMAVVAQPAYAGDEVLFANSPAWVEPVDLDAAIDKGEEIVLYDRQVRLEGGVVTKHTDVAYEIRNTKTLQERGTLQFAWLPDKGDLTIHRLYLVRDGEVIDLVAQGVKPEILRRERSLEKRSVNGMLTAAITVPGMEVGDILRMTTSTTTRDQALQDEMQARESLIAEPTRLGFGRLRVSWPKDADVAWGTMGQFDPPEVISIDGDSVLQVSLPIEEPDEMPEDAPARFRVKPLLQFGTFASWEEVSAVMAPHFMVDDGIEPGSELAGEVARIIAASPDPRNRAALALQLVQDEISYLLNGMDGGNYLPQSPLDTWDKKFGDCKAKSLLLLALLREMQIESEVVLVDADFGDSVSISEPQPGAFDHMIVRATIDGEDYWLDGTNVGARVDTIDEVPDFVWALPLSTEGAGLMRMKQRWPQYPDEMINITLDFSGGVDLPATYTVNVEARGVIAARMRPQATETNDLLILAAANKRLNEIVPGVIYDASFAYDEKSGIGRMEAKGVTWDGFELNRDVATYEIDGATTNWEFKPDRARSAWRDIPYKVGGPYSNARETTVLLPDNGRGAEVEGRGSLDESVASVRFYRTTELRDGTFKLSDRTAYVPAEIAPEDIPAGRRAIRKIASGDPKLRIEQPTRIWELGDEELAARLSPVIDGIGQLIATFDDKAEMQALRGIFYLMARDYDAAQEDLESALTKQESAETYMMLANVQALQGELDDAVINAGLAFDAKGDAETAESYADLLAQAGRPDEALDLLDSLGLSGDEAIDVASGWASISGYADREEEAWERLADLLDERPDDVTLNNAKCWMAAIWNYNIKSALDYCEEAVMLSQQSASVIDSRAMLKFRLGMIDEALVDIDLALTKEPGLANSRYLRGLIRLQQGDEGGQDDLVQAKRIDPFIQQRYGAYDLTP